jgi:NAD(P)-dependent dehydrogenase (short-subunit alcohol dehydrogenase family)
LVKEGAQVVFGDILEQKGKALAAEVGDRVRFQRSDATSPEQTEKLMEAAIKYFGRLDCVVNNAGAGGFGGPSRTFRFKASIGQSICCFVGPFSASNTRFAICEAARSLISPAWPG